MAVAGKVAIGFSEPWVAKYSASGTTVTYSNGQKLARGVEVSITPETSDDNILYCDNIAAETAGGIFTGGSFTLTVDGLFIASEKLIAGLPTAGSDGFTAYGDDQVVPYLGLGFIVKYKSEGQDIYTPVVLAKVSFNPIQTNAATQGDEIDWQTQGLSGTILRGDDANHVWKYVGADEDSEADALAALKTKLGITG